MKEKCKSARLIVFRYLRAEEKSGLLTKALELAALGYLTDSMPEHILAKLLISRVVGGFTVCRRSNYSAW